MNKVRLSFLLLAVLTACGPGTQGPGTQDLSYSKPGKDFYPELPNPKPTDPAEWAAISKPVNVSFASDNVRYAKEKVPLEKEKILWEGKAWSTASFHSL